MDTRMLLIALFVVSVIYQPSSFAEVYQWTDANGTEHYSDTPPQSNGNSSKLKKLKIKKRKEQTTQPQLSQNKDEIKTVTNPTINNTSKTPENNSINPDTENEIKSTWRAFRDAISSGNAQRAVNYLVSSRRQEQFEIFKESGNKLPLLAKEMNEISSVKHVYDNTSAVAIMYRNENVAGKTTQVEFSIDFVRENGRWKIAYY